jgi:hypothetical protein
VHHGLRLQGGTWSERPRQCALLTGVNVGGQVEHGKECLEVVLDGLDKARALGGVKGLQDAVVGGGVARVRGAQGCEERQVGG